MHIEKKTLMNKVRRLDKVLDCVQTKDKVASTIHWKLRGLCGLERREKWYNHRAETDLESSDIEIRWGLISGVTA